MRNIKKSNVIPTFEDKDNIPEFSGWKKTPQEHFDEILKSKKALDKHDKYQNFGAELNKLYHNKCCYCESPLSGTIVEHYRPKNGKNPYYWLVYSWSNLMPICSTCNSKKLDKFPLVDEKARITKPFHWVKKVEDTHFLSKGYQDIEKPIYPNPELDKIPEDTFSCNLKGEIHSENERFKTLIEDLDLNRKELTDNRIRILNDLKDDILECMLDAEISNKKEAVQTQIKLFVKKSNDEKATYTAFRKSFVKNLLAKFVAEMIK